MHMDRRALAILADERNAARTPDGGDRASPGTGAERAGGVLALAMLGLAAIAFWPMLADLERTAWQTLSYSHGYVLAIVIAVLAWREGRTLRPAASHWRLATALLVPALAAALAVRFAAIDAFQQLAFIVVAGLLALAWFGPPGLRRLALPIGLFAFAVPVWDALKPALQTLTVAANQAALRLAGIPALIQGNDVVVPAGTFAIEGGCSGVHFFVVALAGVALYVHAHRLSLPRAMLATVVGVALALLTNWIRVFVIIVRGEATGMQTSLIEDHYWFGWGLFAGAILVFLYLMSRLDGAAAPESRRTDDAPAAGAVRAPATSDWTGVVATTLLVLAFSAFAAVRAGADAAMPELRIEPPTLAGEWQGPALVPAAWRAGFAGPDAEAYAAYRRGGRAVELYAAGYRRQAAGRKLVGFGSSIAGPGWSIVDERIVEQDGVDEGRVRRSVLDGPDGERWLVMYWYQVGDVATADARVVKWREGLQAFGPRVASSVIAAGAACGDRDCGDADEDIDAFLRASGARLASVVVSTPGGSP